MSGGLSLQQVAVLNSLPNTEEPAGFFSIYQMLLEVFHYQKLNANIVAQNDI